MKFTFVSLFPNLIAPYFEDSILKVAKDKNLIDINFVNPRDFTTDKHNKVDRPLIGGGAGMLMSPQPLWECLSHIKKQDKKAYITFLTPVAKVFKQQDAKRLAKKEHIVFVCGRYEGIDERVVEEFANEVLSVGDFILTGGEIAATMLCDSICRCVHGVLGNQVSLEVESFENQLLEAPAFTKPNIFKDLPTIQEYLKGNHDKIANLKKNMSVMKTKYYRPDLYKDIKWEINT